MAIVGTISSPVPVSINSGDVSAGTEQQKMQSLVKKTADLLLHVSTVFPFDLFPDDVTVDKNKITLTHRIFFWTGQVHSIPIEEVGDVIVESGPFFATLKVFHRRLPYVPVIVRYLSKRNARRIQELVQGLVLAEEDMVDVSKIEKRELISAARQTGRVAFTL